MKFAPKLILGVVLTVLFFAVLLLAPAGTFDWWRGWVLLATVGACSIATSLFVFTRDPALLDERFKPPLQPGQPLADKVVISLYLVAFVGAIAFIPIDVFHLRLLAPPAAAVSAFGLVLVALGWLVMALAFKANSFASPVVRHQAERDQTVVTNGAYGVVRHPMYSGAVLLMLGMPLWLESWAATLFALLPIALLAIRIVIEERFLLANLEGYGVYRQRVRFRLLPLVW